MMVNFDMVGRLNDKNELTVYGTGTSPGIDALVDALGKSTGFTIKKIAEGFGPSDQQSFYVKDIPVLFAFTGTHRDYHRPSDDTERINFAGMSRIADFAELLLLDLVRRPERPEFVKVVRGRVATAAADPGRVAVSAYLGSIPDYNDRRQGGEAHGRPRGKPGREGGPEGGRRHHRLRRQAGRARSTTTPRASAATSRATSSRSSSSETARRPPSR